MTRKLTTILLAGAFLVGGANIASADAIVGMWKRPASKGGTLEKISKCGSSFCVTVKSGEFNGKRAGKFKANGDGTYSGEITDLAAEKTYTGKAVLKGNTLDMSGCVLKILCKTEKWTRQ